MQRERYTLEEFCKRMRARHKASYRMVPIRDAVRRGIVVNADGSTVDGVLRTSRGHVAVELLGYSPLHDRGDVMARDVALRKAVKIALYNRLKAKCFSLSLGYREQRRPGPKFGMVRTVPRERDFRSVINELRVIVSEAPALEFNHSLSVRFVKPNIAERCCIRRRTLYLDERLFPVCAAHFTLVRFQGSKNYLPIDIDSELHSGFIGIDDAWVREHVACKAHKSLRNSRVRANGLPLLAHRPQ